MKNYNDTFGYRTFAGCSTAKELERSSEYIKEYKGYSIVFGKYQRDAEGHTWWSVRVWENDGEQRYGTFTMTVLCATDGEAMNMAIRWAKANIDKIA